jgi:DNA-binding NtrC family response regulator
MTSDHILVVDDEPDIRRLVQEILQDEGYEVAVAENAAAARAAYKKRRPDLVLLDIWMPDTDGISLLKEWVTAGGELPPVVMISGHGTVETAVEAIRLGAYDFIEKPLSTAKLLVTVQRALQSEHLRRENLRLKQRVEPAPVLIGKSKCMQALRADIERIAQHDAWVLITGEPGSGKEIAARMLHSLSARQQRPFVEMSLAAVPAQNIAMQLFGSEQGEVIHPGSFEQASGGTLLLNEIADLDLATQARLLGALEDKRFLRVGGREPVETDLRVIAVTSQDLKKAVTEGRFREDLYYRLNVVPLRVPSLREHREDVPELVNYCLDWLVESEHLPFRKFSSGAFNLLRNYSWPGNIRELKNLVQRLLILNRGEEVSEDEVGQALGGSQAESEAYPEALFEMPLRAARDRFEKAYLEHHLRRVGGNVSDLAQVVEMERTHLYRKLKGLGITPKADKDDE